ncbi:MAG: site-specific integrase [Anaerolineae bacterium]|nr:site-specific integrase [Anaerolineae bacterium]
MTALIDLISDQALPDRQELSTSEARLVNQIVDHFPDEPEAQLFIHQAMLALSLHGDLTGLAYSRASYSVPLLCRFLHSEVLYSIQINPGCSEEILIGQNAFQIINQLTNTLRHLASRSEWTCLGKAPGPGSRLIHLQYRLLDSSLYSLIAARLHHGARAKASQLSEAGAEGREFNSVLGGAITPVIRVVTELPVRQARSLLEAGDEEGFDRLVEETIYAFRRPGGRSYAPLTLRTYLNRWRALWTIRASETAFRPRGPIQRNRFWRDLRSHLAADELSRQHPARKSFFDLITRQSDSEGDQSGGEENTRRTSTARPWADAPGRIVLQTTPSRHQPGVLTAHELHLVDAWLLDYQLLESSLNGAAVRGVFDVLLHLGWTVERLLSIRIGPALDSRFYHGSPVYVPREHRLYFVPDRHIGLPDRLLPDQPDGDFERVWTRHNACYEPIDLIHYIDLPGRVATHFCRYAQRRRQVVEQRELHRDFTPDTGPLWLREGGAGKLETLSREHVEPLFEQLSSRLQTIIPGHPGVDETIFRRTWRAYYAGEGLRAPEMFYIAGQAQAGDEMPLRYTCLTVPAMMARLTNIHQHVCAQFKPHQQPGQLPQPTAPPVHLAGRAGSWHTLRTDLVHRLVSGFKIAKTDPGRLFPLLPPDRAARNVFSAYAAFQLGLLAGLRPFEVERLQVRHFDPADGGWLSVHGKGRPQGPAYRQIPLPAHLKGELAKLAPNARGTAPLIGFIDSQGKLKPPGTGTLDWLLQDVLILSSGETLPNLAFYGLRHRCRTDLFEAGCPRRVIDLVLGHAGRGVEPGSLYGSEPLDGIGDVYRQCADRLAERYGVAES